LYTDIPQRKIATAATAIIAAIVVPDIVSHPSVRRLTRSTASVALAARNSALEK
jgi:hypothetical protein